MKAKFRQSVAWKTFRKEKMLEQNGLDPITKRRLTKHYHCHHVIQTNDLDVYKDLSDTNNFVAVNSQSHDAIHYGLNLIKNNGFEAFERYVKEVVREAILNEYDVETFTVKGD